MDLATYRKQQGVSQEAFAKLLTDAGSPATQGLVSHWEAGSVLVPPERWRFVEDVTGGAVSRHDLRPDVFGPAPGGQADAA